MTNPFQTAFADYAPVLAAEFTSYFTRIIERAIADGENHDSLWRKNKEASQFAKFDGSRLSSKVIGINHDWLAKSAANYGTATVDSFVAKLTKKLGCLIDVEVRRANASGSFVITGKLGDRIIRVEQQQVFKISTHGTPFHQWPARIYVDSKFTPEASFKKLAA